MDSVDDLEYAEDELKAAAHLIDLLTRRLSELGHEVMISTVWAYCRPTCGWLDEGWCSSGGPDECGCPCEHEGAGLGVAGTAAG